MHPPDKVPCPSLSKFNIVPIETDSLTDRLGTEPILSVTVIVHVNWPLPIMFIEMSSAG